jgi:hypothetical protein
VDEEAIGTGGCAEDTLEEKTDAEFGEGSGQGTEDLEDEGHLLHFGHLRGGEGEEVVAGAAEADHALGRLEWMFICKSKVESLGRGQDGKTDIDGDAKSMGKQKKTYISPT